jgi:hypothetical protein
MPEPACAVAASPKSKPAKRPYRPRAHRRELRTESGIALPRALDGRTVEMRKLRAMIEGLELEFGALAESERATIKTVARIQMLLDQVQPGIGEGRCTEADKFIRLSSERRRLLQDLRAKSAASKQDGPTELDQYLAENYPADDADTEADTAAAQQPEQTP